MVTYQQAMGIFAKTYSHMTDDQLLGLYVEQDAFLAGAYWTLLAELRKRSLPTSALRGPTERNAAVKRAPNFGEGEVELCSSFGRR